LIKEVTFGIEREMKLSFAEPKSGNVRRSDGHIASARGEAPAVDTGFLTNSILTEMTGPLEGLVTVGAEYGFFLEEMLDRPFVEPAIDKAIEAAYS
jgi:hypothetical protein